MIITGKLYKFGDDVNTDEIIPARYLNTSDPKELAAHVMEDADPQFPAKVHPGDILVAGKNFGCGSSREHAPIAIKAAGIACVVAESYARIFYRNAINLGVPLLVCPNISQLVQNGDALSLDLQSGDISNAKGVIIRAETLSEYVLNILENGGIKPLIKKQLEAQTKA